MVTEFPIPTAGSGPAAIASGPGNLWFTELLGNQIGRITPAGVVTEFPVPTADSGPEGIVFLPHGDLWFTESSGNQIGKITRGPLTPQPMDVDANEVAGSGSNVNGVLEPGETVQVAPVWMNTLTSPQSFGGTASNLTGPAGPAYTIDDSAAGYGTVAAGASADCIDSPGGCYLMTVSGSRPVQHWDATFTETLSASTTSAQPAIIGLPVKTWTLHVGESFPDVPTSNSFYAFVENLFHNGVTGGCGGSDYCPGNSVTRAQMAVFLMKSKLGAAEIPPPATGIVFADVPASNPFAAFIEQLAHFGITGGCGGGNYCPNNPVTRAQMAAFLMKAQHGSAYVLPACTGVFPDVTCPSQFADWIEQLHAEGITSRLRRRRLLSEQPEHARPDGCVPRQNVRAAAVRAVGEDVRAPTVSTLKEARDSNAVYPRGRRPAVAEPRTRTPTRTPTRNLLRGLAQCSFSNPGISTNNTRGTTRSSCGMCARGPNSAREASRDIRRAP